MTDHRRNDTSDPEKERYVAENFTAKARKFLGRVGFVEDAAAAYICARDPATPTYVKAIIIGALAYFIAPIDAVPDLIVLLGFGDDAAVFYMAWRTVSEHVNDVHRAAARRLLGTGEDGGETGS